MSDDNDNDLLNGLPDPNKPVRVMIGMPRLPTLKPEEIPCTSASGHHWDQEGRCHTCGISHPNSQPYLLCSGNYSHGRATNWCFDVSIDAFVGMCDKCTVDIVAYAKRAREIEKEQASAQAAATRRRGRLN